MLEGVMQGLTTALSLQNLIMVIAGCLIGTFIGMLPGLGPMSIIAIMIPVAISIGDPAAALIMLAGVYYGAIFGGSTSSILINAPGVASTVATSFDGYPLARAGKAGKALTVAAISSFAGGSIGAILLMVFAPALATVALLFHSAEWNSNATLASAGAKPNNRMTPTVPPQNDEIAAMASAFPARPLRAMG